MKNGDYQTQAKAKAKAKAKEEMEQKAAADATTAIGTKKNKTSSSAKNENGTKTSLLLKVPAVKIALDTTESKGKPVKQVAKVAGKGPKKMNAIGVKKAMEPPKQQSRGRGKTIAAVIATELVPSAESDAAVVGKKKGGKAKLPSAPVRSLLERLQETTEAARLARDLLCSSAPSLRAVMLGVVNLGFYFSTHRRRTKFSTQWSREYIKGEKFTKGEKLTASIKVWVVYLGLSAELQKVLVDRVMSFLMACWKEEDDRIAAAKVVNAAAAAEARALTTSTKTKGKGMKGSSKSIAGKGKKRYR